MAYRNENEYIRQIQKILTIDSMQQELDLILLQLDILKE